jgi:hypothetical protein
MVTDWHRKTLKTCAEGLVGVVNLILDFVLLEKLVDWVQVRPFMHEFLYVIDLSVKLVMAVQKQRSRAKLTLRHVRGQSSYPGQQCQAAVVHLFCIVHRPVTRISILAEQPHS